MLKWIEETGDNCVIVAISIAVFKAVNVELSWGILIGLAGIGVVMSFGAFFARRHRKTSRGS